MQFMPGHFACDAVWSTIIYVHSRLKMGPNMGCARGGYLDICDLAGGGGILFYLIYDLLYLYSALF